MPNHQAVMSGHCLGNSKALPLLDANKFDVYTGHYALQMLKSMRTGSVLLHCWSVALEEFDFTVHHRPGKAQIHVDGLSRLPVEQAPPKEEETALVIQPLADKAAAHQAVHSCTKSLMWEPRPYEALSRSLLVYCG